MKGREHMAVFSVTMHSHALQRNVPLMILYPSDTEDPKTGRYEKARQIRVLYLLHGFEGCCNDWLYNTRIKLLARQHRIAVVMPSGENLFYNDVSTVRGNFEQFLTEDLIAFMENTFHVSRKREDRLIAGLSMGGYGAIVNGLRHPELYSVIGGFSSALLDSRLAKMSVSKRPEDAEALTWYCHLFSVADIREYTGSRNDCSALARTVPADQRPVVYLSCGTEDSLYPASESFASLLDTLGYQLTWEKWTGDHNWKFWDESIERFLTQCL